MATIVGLELRVGYPQAGRGTIVRVVLAVLVAHLWLRARR